MPGVMILTTMKLVDLTMEIAVIQHVFLSAYDCEADSGPCVADICIDPDGNNDDCSNDGDDGGDSGGGDGGDGECQDGYVDDCSGDGDCCPEAWIGDGLADCEDQPWGCDLSCYDDDGGDCEEGGDDGGTDGGSDGDDGGNNGTVSLTVGETTEIIGEMPGEGILYGATVPLFYESSVPIGGIQFTMYDSPDWATGIELSSVVEDCFDANFNDVNGFLIGILFSLEGCELDAAESSVHFANITYTLSADSEWGSQVGLDLNNVIVSDGVGNALSVNTQGGFIDVSLLGDVSSDSEVNILDIVSLISFILLIDESSDYQAWAGDVNEDTVLKYT